MTTYTIEACQNYISWWNDKGGEVKTIREGCLGLGVVILFGLKGYKPTIIEEVYVNDWNCTHKVNKYNKLPNKYQKFI